jgi:hypothetical protein
MQKQLCFTAKVFFWIFVILSAGFGSHAYSAEVTLAWDANSEPDLQGYKLYYKIGSAGIPYNGTGAVQGDSPITIPLETLENSVSPQFTIEGLSCNKVYYFAVTAYNNSGESGYSNDVRFNDDDNDQMADDWEAANGINNPGSDPDHDGLTNIEEFNNGTDPIDSDTDNDGLPDAWEIQYGLNPLSASGVDGGNGDLDNDHWTNYEEYLNSTDPGDSSYPIATPPELVEAMPHDNAGIADEVRVPNNSSFSVRIKDSEGIDITDPSSVRFTIDDGDNQPYVRDIGNSDVVRIVKLSDDEDTQVAHLWAVYDRCRDIYGDFSFDADIDIRVDIKDRRQVWMVPLYFSFHVESASAHDTAHDPNNLPAACEVDSSDTALEGAYSAGIEVYSGELKGAKIIYDADEPVTPEFGPTGELLPLISSELETLGLPMNLQPPTVFNTPVKIFIPCPGYDDVSDLDVYLYSGTRCVRACDASGNVLPAGEGWMVPGSRVNHNDGEPSTIEIKAYHFSGIQAGISSDETCQDISAVSSEGGSSGGGGGCFIATLTAGAGHRMVQEDCSLKVNWVFLILIINGFLMSLLILSRQQLDNKDRA